MGQMTAYDIAVLMVFSLLVSRGSNLVVTVSLSADVQGGVTVNYATADGTARTDTDSDYTAASGTLTFSGTAGTQSVTVSTTADTKVEADETLTVSLSGVTATAGVPG